VGISQTGMPRAPERAQRQDGGVHPLPAHRRQKKHTTNGKGDTSSGSRGPLDIERVATQTGTDGTRDRFTFVANNGTGSRMTQYLLAGVAAAVLMSGVAAAQTYPPAPPPPGTMVMPAAPPAPVVPPPPPGVSSSTTTTVAPTPYGDHREVTIHKEVDENGKAVTEKETHQEGVSGSSETHTKTETNPDTGATTRTTTTKHE
jgi:hypothetical protein